MANQLKKPGLFSTIAVMIRLAINNPEKMYSAACELREQCVSLIEDDPMLSGPDYPFTKIGFYGSVATVMFQNSGHFKDAAEMGWVVTCAANKAIEHNPYLKMSGHNAAAAHAGAWSAIMTSNAVKDDVDVNSWYDIAIRQHDLAKMVYEEESAGHVRMAALAGTMALIRFSGGDKDGARNILAEAERINAGQLKKELSSSWPKSDEMVIPDGWDAMVESLSLQYARPRSPAVVKM